MHIALLKVQNICDFNLDITFNWVTEKKYAGKNTTSEKSNKSPHQHIKFLKADVNTASL